MTTIRVTRRPAADAGTSTAPTSAAEPGPDRVDDGVRLALTDPPDQHASVDGAWWPRTADLAEELPGLVAELHRRGIRVTRVAYNPGAWAPVDRRLQTDGRTIRLGWFRSLDPHLLNLTGDEARGRVDLVTVPPESSPSTAQRAFAAATDPANRQAATALLDGLGTAAGDGGHSAG